MNTLVFSKWHFTCIQNKPKYNRPTERYKQPFQS